MSMENVRNFFNELEDNQSLRAEFEQFVDPQSDNVANNIVDFGKKSGFEFNIEDLRAHENEVLNGELSDEELEDVAGGFFFNFIRRHRTTKSVFLG